MKIHNICVFAGACSIAFTSTSLIAQESQREGALEEIIITAEKRTESLQDVPVAVTAFSTETRDEVGITSIQDLTNFTPGLNYSTNTDRITLRGIGRFTNNLASDPGVAVYADGIFTSSTTEAGRSPMFAARTEVLRGPQGTLYGRNSIGGAINVISPHPEADFGAEIRTSYGSYGRRRLEAMVTGPLNDSFNYLVGGSTVRQDEGFFENVNSNLPDEGGVLNDQFYLAELEGSFDNVDVFLKYQRSNWDQRRRSLTRAAPYDTNLGLNSTGGGTALLPPGSLVPSALYNSGVGTVPGGPFAGNYPLPPAAQQYTATNPSVSDRRKFRVNTPFQTDLDENDSWALDLTWHMGWADLRYIGGYQHYLYTQVWDFDNTDRVSYDYFSPFGGTATVQTTLVQEYIEDKTWASHEINLSSTHDGSLQWLLGVYQFDEHYDQPYTIYSGDQAELRTPCYTVNFVSCLAPAPANPDGIVYQISTTMNKSESFAYFGQVDWAFSDTWSMTFGLRHTEDKKDATENTRLVYWDPTFATTATTQAYDISGLSTPGNVIERDLVDSWSGTTGTLGFEWAPISDMLLFAKYSKGYKAGGFNSGRISADPTVEEESIDAYELGLKSTLADSLRLNVAAYFYDYQDFQDSLSVVPVGGGPLTSEYLNLPEAESMGIEIEAVWTPINSIDVLFNYSWADSEITDACCFVDSSDRAARGKNAKPVAPVTTGGGAPVFDPTIYFDAMGAPLPPQQQMAQSIEGNRLPSTPEHKVAINVQYNMDFADGLLTFSLSEIWRSETNYSLFDRPDSTADSYSKVDFRVLWRDNSDRYTIIAAVQNVFDKDGFEGMSSSQTDDGTIYTSPSLTDPRTYNLELQYRF